MAGLIFAVKLTAALRHAFAAFLPGAPRSMLYMRQGAVASLRDGAIQ